MLLLGSNVIYDFINPVCLQCMFHLFHINRLCILFNVIRSLLHRSLRCLPAPVTAVFNSPLLPERHFCLLSHWITLQGSLFCYPHDPRIYVRLPAADFPAMEIIEDLKLWLELLRFSWAYRTDCSPITANGPILACCENDLASNNAMGFPFQYL